MAEKLPYSSITEDVLSVIKRPPLVGPTCSRDYDSNTTSDAIGFLQFEFKYRYVYDNGEKSVWSPTDHYITKLDDIFTCYGYRAGIPFPFNSIQISLTIDDVPTIDKVEVAVREGYLSNWYLLGTYDVSSHRGSTYPAFNWHNNKALVAIDASDIARRFDYVPLKAQAQALISDNIISYGSNLMGFDNPSSVSVALSTSTINNTKWTNITSGAGQVVSRKPGYIEVQFDLNLIDGATLEIIIYGDDQSYSYVLPTFVEYDGSWGFMSNDDIINYFVRIMADCPILSSVTNTSSKLRVVFNGDIYDEQLQLKIYEGNSALACAKSGAVHYLGIEYADKYGRVGSVVRNDDMNIEVPWVTEVAGKTHLDFYQYISYQINHRPPSWAHRWRFVYGGHNLSWFQTYVLRSHGADDRSIWYDNDQIKIKINEGVNNCRDVLPRYGMQNYVFEPGDRLRVIGTRDDGEADYDGGTEINAPVTLADEYIDLEINKFDGQYIYIDNWDKKAGAPSLDEGKDIVVEVYRKIKKSESPAYFGMSSFRHINNPGQSNRSHGSASGSLIQFGNCYMTNLPLMCAKTDNQRVEELTPAEYTTSTTTTTTSTSTTVTEDFSHYGRGNRGVMHVLAEHMGSSPFVDSYYPRTTDINFYDEDSRQKWVNEVRWGGRFFADSKINNVCRFLYDDVKRLDDDFGSIRAMHQVGYTLHALQEAKNTSIYLGREMAVDAEGNQRMILTSNVLGEKRPALENFGTIHPMSVVASNRWLYYFDFRNAKVVRSDPNGQDAISLLAMDTYFRDKVADLADSGLSNIDVVAGRDDKNGIVFFTFKDTQTAANEATVGYHERSKRWISFYSFKPEMYGRVGEKEFLTFSSGALYKHNQDSPNRNHFYGSDYSSQVWLVFNADPAMMKNYESIEQMSNAKWTASNNGDIEILPTGLYPSGMQSKLRAADLVEYESNYRGSFLRDMLSGDESSASDYYLYNGRLLKGRNMMIKLQNSDTTEVNLFAVKVGYLISM